MKKRVSKKNIHLESMHPKTIWCFIKDDIELKIINGELKSADKVPSIFELASLYNVSKSTAQKALEDLFNDGTITKRKGIGYFVVPYTREKLRNQHLKGLMIMLDNCFTYAEKLGVSSEDISYLKECFSNRIT